MTVVLNRNLRLLHPKIYRPVCFEGEWKMYTHPMLGFHVSAKFYTCTYMGTCAHIHVSSKRLRKSSPFVLLFTLFKIFFTVLFYFYLWMLTLFYFFKFIFN